jgi:hypothetical protein
MYIHHMARLVRKQVYITAEQEERLKHIAAREKRSEAEIIRAALDDRLQARPAAAKRLADDPLWAIVGIGAAQAHDISEHVDRELYGATRT